MRLVVHKNDGKGLIDLPVIMIAGSEETPLEVHLAMIDPALEPTIVDEASLPDRGFVRAWSLSDGVVGVDMPKARDVHRMRMRAIRAPKLARLDIEFQRALETGADTSAIVAQKQALRDVTEDPAIEAASTLDELKAVWPEILGEQP